MPNQPKKDKEKSVQMYKSDQMLFMGIWVDEELVAEGSIELSGFNHPWRAPVAIFGLCVLDEYAGLGLGTHLLKELEKWAIKKGVHRIEATVRHNNKKAIGLYLKMGYQIEGIARETAFFDQELLLKMGCLTKEMAKEAAFSDGWQHEYYIGKIVNSSFSTQYEKKNFVKKVKRI